MFVFRDGKIALVAVTFMSLCGCASVALQGNPRTEFSRGLSIMRHVPTAQGRAAGFRWIRRAARGNLAVAQDRLGLMYLYGEGVKKNVPHALRWIRRAAECGAAAAQMQLGNFYASGTSVPRSDSKAYYWFRVAAKPVGSSMTIYNIAQVRAIARRRADDIAGRLTSAERAAVDQRVATWMPTPSVPYSGLVSSGRLIGG